MEENLLKTLELLEASFKSTESNKQKEYYEKLKELSQDRQQHINILLKALSINIYNNFNISLELHKSIAIYLKNYIQSQINNMSEDEIKDFMNALLDLIFNSNEYHLSNSVICQTLNNIIEQIITKDSYLSDGKKLDDILIYILNQISKDDENFITKAKNTILIINTITQSKCIQKENIENFIKYFIFQVSDKIFDKTKNYINSDSINEDYLIILKGVCENFNNIIIKLKSHNNKIEICNQFFQKYNTILYELLTYKLPNEKNENTNQIINFFNNNNLCEKINVLKAKTLQLYTTIIQISSNIEKEITIKDLIQICINIIQLIVSSLEDILKNSDKLKYIIERNYEENFFNNSFEIILYHMFNFLSKTLIREPIKTQFFPFLKNFLLNIIFPFIVSNTNDKTNLELEGENYYNNLMDNLKEFKGKNCKTACCFLIKKLYDKIIDMRNFILSYVFQMINYILMEQKPINDPSFSLYLESKANNVLIDQYNDEIKIDFCLIILLIFNQDIPYSHFEPSLRKLINQYMNQLNNINFPLIKSKMCIFYDFYWDILSKDIMDDINQNIFNFLMNSILQSKDKYYSGLSYCASYTLFDKLNENEKCSKYIEVIINQEQNLEMIIYLIDEVDIIPFYKLLSEIINVVMINNREKLFIILKKIVSSILKDIVKLTNIIPYYFNILKNFVKGINKIENQNEIKIFSEMIEPIVNYIKNSKKIDFEEDIILLVNDLMDSCKAILPISYLVFQYLEPICKISTLKNYVYKIISNLISLKNNNQSEIDLKNYYNEIFKILKNIQIDDNQEKQYLLLIILKLFANYNFTFEKDLFKTLILKVYNLYNQNYNHLDDVLLNNLTSLAIIFVGFIYFSDMTYQILNENNILNNIFLLIKNIINLKSESYCITISKCIILGICSILKNINCLEDLINKNLLNDLIKTLYFLILKQKNEQIQENKNLMKKELDCNFVEEEESSDDDEEDFEDSDEYEDVKKETENTIKEISDINNSDVYEYFTNSMKNLEEINKPIVLNFINSLNEIEKKNLENIIHTRQVKVNYNDQTIYIPRRTVKIIRNTPNN